MALPKAVLQAVKHAEAAHAEAYPVTPVTTDGEEPNVVQPSQTTDGSPDVVEPSVTPVDTPKPDDVTNPPSAVEPVTVEPVEANPDSSFKQKYDTLKGKYDAEIPRLSQQVRTLSGELSDTQSVLAALGSVESTDVPIEPVTLLTPQEIEEYGPDLISIMRKAAKEEIQPIVNKLEADNASLIKNMATAAEKTATNARQRMYELLDSGLSNWREVNKEANFLDWLTGSDLLSGSSKQALLTNAFESNDASRVLLFFNTYLEQTISSADASPATNAQPATAAEVIAPVELDTLVAPGKPRGSEVTTGAQDGEKSIWTEAEIAAFYNDVRMGKFKDNPEEHKRIEADLFAAASEPGRIVPNVK